MQIAEMLETLADWLVAGRYRLTVAEAERLVDRMDAEQREGKSAYWSSPSNILAPPAGKVVRRAEAIFRRVMRDGGPGARRGLVELGLWIAKAGDPASGPFWMEAATFEKPRDPAAGDRRSVAAAGLAMIAVLRGDAKAWRALSALATGPDERLRGPGSYALAWAAARGRPPAEGVRALGEAVAGTPDLPARVLAIQTLRALGAPPALEQDRAHIFRVRFQNGGGFSVDVAVRADQTLDDLHRGIIESLGWEDDHLYAFYLSGRIYDGATQISDPRMEDSRPSVSVEIADLAPRRGDSFAYLFDFGDSHAFVIRYLRAAPLEPGRHYPHEVDMRGEPPPQYPHFDGSEG